MKEDDKVIKRCGRIIAFYPELARELGDIQAAIFYQQLFYWSNKGSRDDGFIFKSKSEIEEETTLSPKQQDRVRKLLIVRGWLEVKKIKAFGAPTLHYRVCADLGLSIMPKGNNGNIPKVTMECDQRDESSNKRLQQEITTREDTILAKQVSQVLEVFVKLNPTLSYGNKTQRSSAACLIEKIGFDRTLTAAQYAISVMGDQYSPRITTPLELKEKLGKLIAYKQKCNNSIKVKNYD